MKRACVIGWPIGHSRSPLIHGYWLSKYGLDGSYSKEAVKPDELGAFLGALAQNGFAGCNVTVPHKQVAFALAKERDESAVAVAAANTLWLENGKLCAANTDAVGFMAHLNASAPDWQRRDAPVSILGAGGAARALVHGFLSAGVEEIRIFNRTRSRGDELAAHFGTKVKVYDWQQRTDRSRKALVLVNTTTLGMTGAPALDMDISNCADDTVIADIVYTPLETGLLALARARALTAVDGLGMLLHQAVPGFEKWFGRRPEVTDELRALVVADIEGGQC